MILIFYFSFVISHFLDLQIRFEMPFVFIINPPCQETLALSVPTGSLQDFLHHPFVFIGQDEEGGFTMKMIPDGNFARYDVGQRIDEDGWTWEIIVFIVYRFLIVPVRGDGRGMIEKDDCPFLVRFSLFCIQQDF